MNSVKTPLIMTEVTVITRISHIYRNFLDLISWGNYADYLQIAEYIDTLNVSFGIDSFGGGSSAIRSV